MIPQPWPQVPTQALPQWSTVQPVPAVPTVPVAVDPSVQPQQDVIYSYGAIPYSYASVPATYSYSPYYTAYPAAIGAHPGTAFIPLTLPTIPKTIFVGNLPASVTNEFLEQLYSQFGVVQQVKYMKAKHYAFITFESPKEATWAKANTNGITLEGRALRVSWGKEAGQQSNKQFDDDDDNFYLANKPPQQQQQQHQLPLPGGLLAAAPNLVPIVVSHDYIPASLGVVEGSDLEVHSTLFVGNLSPQTTATTLQAFFKQFGRVINSRVNSDKHYGFVTFAMLADAQTAKSLADGVMIDGRPLRINWGKQQEGNVMKTEEQHHHLVV